MTEPIYAKGGFIGPVDSDSIPLPLSRGCVLMSWSSFKAMGGTLEAAKALFPNSDVEVVFSASEVKEYGEAALAKLGRQNDAEDPDGAGPGQ